MALQSLRFDCNRIDPKIQRLIVCPTSHMTLGSGIDGITGGTAIFN